MQASEDALLECHKVNKFHLPKITDNTTIDLHAPAACDEQNGADHFVKEYPCNSELHFERLFYEVHRLCDFLHELRKLYPRSFGEMKFQFHWNSVVETQRMEDLSAYREIISVCGDKPLRDLSPKELARLLRKLDYYFAGHCSRERKECLRQWCKTMAMFRLEGFESWVEER